MKQKEIQGIYRVLDVNFNRLREALRVIEEFVRFIRTDAHYSSEIKTLRHSLRELEEGVDSRHLIANRDTSTDPFSRSNSAREQDRKGADEVLAANFKRAQEASRVIEEYIKLTDTAHLSATAKTLRFSLYSLEKKFRENYIG
ncbi:MAG: thiamine-phosphate pyrophosphorylase [Chitinivibrionales bacterium]|nr:thiamine-phosphate pyrophosphorylase [Chitinivibrionales bacterium]